MPPVSTSDHKVKGDFLNSHIAARSQVATVVNSDEGAKYPATELLALWAV